MEAPQEPEKAPTLVVTAEQIDAGVDLIHRTGLGVGKMLMLEHGDVPRLLVSAGCRSLEQLIEFYDKTKEKQDVTGRARLQLQIRTLADNLHGALEEALGMVTAVRASLTPPDEAPATEETK